MNTRYLESGRNSLQNGIRIETNPDWAIEWWHPHVHHDRRLAERFIHEQLPIFQRVPGTGEQVPQKLNWEFDDRLIEYDQIKANRAKESAEASGVTPNSAHYVEVYLSAYYGKPAKIWRIDVTNDNGFPIHAYGFVLE